MNIKVCGITQFKQLQQLDALNIDYAGLIFYKDSPRYMGGKITGKQIKDADFDIKKVGVFVNPTYEELMKTVENYRLDMVQLHGDESPKFCDKIADYISVIKAFRLSDNDSIVHMTQSYTEVCDFFMFDTLGAGYGGTGKKFDWTILEQSLPLKPYFLSGGIEPGDEKKLEEFIGTPAGEKLFAVDINTKFEIGPGVKDVNSVKKFAENLGIKKVSK